MTYKDKVEEFEALDKKLTEAFENLFNRRKASNVAQPVMPAALVQKVDAAGKPLKQYTYKNSPLSQDVSKSIAQYKSKKSLEAKCQTLGSSGPNDVFELGENGISATFGKVKNFVRDIRGLEISKDELTCYDLVKDKFKIAWLFADSAVFRARKIWGKPGKIYFDGVWKSGYFKGIMTSNSRLDGGLIVAPGKKIQAFGQRPATPVVAPAVVAPAVVPQPEVKVYIATQGVKKGPYTLVAINNLIASGEINKNTWVWAKELGDMWVKAGGVKSLKPEFEKLPPEIPQSVQPAQQPAQQGTTGIAKTVTFESIRKMVSEVLGS